MELALMFKSTIAVLSSAGELIVEQFEINHDIEGVKLLEEKIKDIKMEKSKKYLIDKLLEILQDWINALK